jgi:hypothetical protein
MIDQQKVEYLGSDIFRVERFAYAKEMFGVCVYAKEMFGVCVYPKEMFGVCVSEASSMANRVVYV